MTSESMSHEKQSKNQWNLAFTWLHDRGIACGSLKHTCVCVRVCKGYLEEEMAEVRLTPYAYNPGWPFPEYDPSNNTLLFP